MNSFNQIISLFCLITMLTGQVSYNLFAAEEENVIPSQVCTGALENVVPSASVIPTGSLEEKKAQLTDSVVPTGSLTNDNASTEIRPFVVEPRKRFLSYQEWAPEAILGLVIASSGFSVAVLEHIYSRKIQNTQAEIKRLREDGLKSGLGPVNDFLKEHGK